MKSPEFLMTQGVNGSRRSVNWLRLLGIAVLLIAGAAVIAYLLLGGEEEKKKTKREERQTPWSHGLAYDYDPPKAPPVEEPELPGTPEPEEEEEEEEEKEPDPRIEILREANNGEIKRFSSDLGRLQEFREVAMSAGAGGECSILPGDRAFLRPIDFMSTDNGGTLVAELAESIPGNGCDIAMEAGAKFVSVVDESVDFAQKGAGVVFQTITTNDGNVISAEQFASGQMGSGGVPGDVDRHIPSKIFGVAVATAVDLAESYLGSQGDGFNIMTDNTGSLLEDFVRPYVTRKDTITRDPTKEPGLISVTFTQKISL